jgi:hypothetical protein
MELKKYSGVEFYLDLLRDVYWRSPALEVISKWLGEDRQRVEFILNAQIGKLFTVFKTTKEALQFQNLLVPSLFPAPLCAVCLCVVAAPTELWCVAMCGCDVCACSNRSIVF